MNIAVELRKLKKRDNIFYLKVFLYIVGIFIIVSVIYRGIMLWNKRFYITPSFKTLILAKDAYIVNTDRASGRFTVAIWKGKGKELSGKSKLENSIILQTPINGELIQSPSEYYSGLIFSYFSVQNMIHVLFPNQNHQYKDMNIFDMIKIYFSAKSVSNSNITEEEINNNTSPDNLYNLFKDQTVINEKASVEIINAAGINGLGTKIATMLKNGGFNVVSVTSSDIMDKSKIIYRVSLSPTLRHLFQIFPFPSFYNSETSIADVSVILGRDIPLSKK